MRVKRFIVLLVFLVVGLFNVYAQDTKSRSSVGVSIGIDNMFNNSKDKHTVATIDYRIFEGDFVGIGIDYNLIFQNSIKRDLYKKNKC